MKVVHINYNYNQSTIYKNMAEILINEENPGSVYFPTISSYKKKESELHFLNNRPILNKIDKFFYRKRNKILFKDFLKTYNINELRGTFSYSLFSNGFLSYLLYKKYNIPYVVLVQNTDVNHYFKKRILLRKTGIKILKNAKKIIFITPKYRDKVIDNYIPFNLSEKIKSKTVVIPFGIDNYWFDNINPIIKKHNVNKIKLLYVGRINKNKNMKTTILACDNLKRMGYEVVYTLVGEVEDDKILNELLKRNYVNHINWVRKENLIKIYRDNDIFLMPSIKESFGLVYAEALSQGLPIIYTRGQGFDGQFIEGKVGYSVDPYNPNEITNNIIKIVEDYHSISLKALNGSLKFKWSNLQGKYLDVFTQNFK